MVDTFNAYPHLLHVGLKHRFPFAVINVIVTAVGGEHSADGAQRFQQDVLGHQPDVILIDYALNDRKVGLDAAYDAWERMIDASLAYGAKLLLLTPTADATQLDTGPSDDKGVLANHAIMIRQLAATHGVGLVDSFNAFHQYAKARDLTDLLSWTNHPNREGHELVAKEILRWFPAV